jgi:hypothetical protein
MKEISILLLLLILIFSCKDEESDISILGYWEYHSIIPQNPISLNEIYDAEFMASYNWYVNECFDLSLDFLESGKVYAVIVSNESTDCEGKEYITEWELNADKSRLYMDLPSVRISTFEIELSKNTLILKAYGKITLEDEKGEDFSNYLDVKLIRAP